MKGEAANVAICSNFQDTLALLRVKAESLQGKHSRLKRMLNGMAHGQDEIFITEEERADYEGDGQYVYDLNKEFLEKVLLLVEEMLSCDNPEHCDSDADIDLLAQQLNNTL